MRLAEKEELRKKRHRRLRFKVIGTAERPRLNVSRSLQHIYAQLIDDSTGNTLATASTVDKTLREDPAGTYASMDFSTRDAYRHVVEKIARLSGAGEMEVAQCVLRLAQGWRRLSCTLTTPAGSP